MNFCVAILILKVEENKQHFLHVVLYYLKKGKNTIEIQKTKICAAHGEGAVSDKTCQKWFAVFRAGDFSLYDAPQWGRPVEVDSHQIKTLIENNQHYNMWERANILKIFKPSIRNPLHQLGYVNHFDVWVPCKLSKENLNCVSTRDTLLKCNENVPF